MVTGDIRVLRRLGQVVGRIIEHPGEEKYRSLKLSSVAVQELLAVRGLEGFLCSAGFQERHGVLFMPEPCEETLQQLRRARVRISTELQAREHPAEAFALASEVSPAAPALPQAAIQEGSGPRLVVFDFDSTITVSRERDLGLSGRRLQRLQDMASHLLAVGTHTVLVTAQREGITEFLTVPALRRSMLLHLFSAPELAARQDAANTLFFHRNNPAQGGIYTGAEAWVKMPLIAKIIAGENRWRMAFSPSRVLFVDDDPANFNGFEGLGISVRHVQQDGMNEADIACVEAFASSGSGPGAA